MRRFSLFAGKGEADGSCAQRKSLFCGPHAERCKAIGECELAQAAGRQDAASRATSELFATLPAEARIRRVHRTATRTSADLGCRAWLVGRAHCILEVLDGAANARPKLGKAVRSKNDKHDDEDDDQFRQSYTAHGDTPLVPDRPEGTD